jgi:Zn-finger nucleic acid-binding protein
MQCPQCNQTLNDIEYEGVIIRTCNGCGGEFIGAIELSHIVRTRQERFPETVAEALVDHQPSFGIPAEQNRRTLHCPDCGNQMSVINYCGDSGVFIDRCCRCGALWLDRDELEQVQLLTERWADEAPEQIRALAGELEMARKQAAQRCDRAFTGSRFAFVNALINRFLDAA